MVTTSPDNLWSPDLDDEYALTQHMGSQNVSIQNAFDRRANAYKGTSVERSGFSNPPEGVLWQDTNGTQQLYVRSNGQWRTVVPSAAEETYSFSSPIGPYGGSYNDNNRPRATRSGDWVELRGTGTVSNSSTIAGTDAINMFSIGQQFRPTRNIVSSRLQGSGDASWSMQVNSSGVVTVSRYSVSGHTSALAALPDCLLLAPP